ncbi:MAG: FKBP-type peptidyl-prolyl cis-trans isomerase [Thermodesulfovibrionales bacterium]|nr:FKBP-type peptidyl-prolyl cis-trans isomerase [Thermodesulfovibrionales bacterium]MDP3111149.1 FKBP-type peptidyl-prolyl cis-trans isomerase [Thermodesulfovibrionales bacterium]
MATVKEGDRVRVHYTGKLEDGTVFDSSRDGTPLEFTVGKAELIKGFDRGVIGMSAGESKTIKISAEDAYGPHNKERVFEFNRDRSPQDFDPAIGQQVHMQRVDGQPVVVTVIDKSDKSFTMDSNHHMAGKNLTFDITLVEIV